MEPDVNRFKVYCQSVSIYLLVCLLVGVCVCLSISFHLSLSLSLYFPLSLFCPPFSPFVDLSTKISTSICLPISIDLLIWKPATNMFFYTYPPWYHRFAIPVGTLAMYLYIYLSIYLSIYLFIYLFIYLWFICISFATKTNEENPRIRDLNSTSQGLFRWVAGMCFCNDPWRLWNGGESGNSIACCVDQLILRNPANHLGGVKPCK